MSADKRPAPVPPSRFRDALEPVLPNAEAFTLIHVVSYPKKVRKLIFTSREDKTLDTVVTHYFILVHDGVAVFALELLSYEAKDACTLFVSKADTSGHYTGSGRLNVMAVTQTLIRETLLAYFAPHKTARICVFAKAEGQYLLLGSVNNPQKHILSDAALVKWWVRCIDGLHSSFTAVRDGKCTLAIPGIDDPAGVARYFPSEAKLPWSAGDIFWTTARPDEDDAVLAVKRIPRFPDDPKSRFLDALVAEQRAKQVSRKLFWLEMQSRQEFRLGKSVGILGLEGCLEKPLRAELRTPPVTNKQCNRFKELLISLDFTTRDLAADSTDRLLNAVPDSSLISVTGSAVPTVQSSRPQVVPEKRINTLGMGMVRKKQKTKDTDASA